MKYRKEWYTCDRCGVEITTRKKVHKRMLFPGSKILELCPKCKKEFERFMRNEN